MREALARLRLAFTVEGRESKVLLLAAVPGLVFLALSLLSYAPSSGELLGYFVPLRVRLGEVLRGLRGPFWNPDLGCGEPLFANPQTALLYPPAWIGALLPGPLGTGVEFGLHLAILGAGLAALARRLGAAPSLSIAAAWGAALSGPLLRTSTLLNSLESLAWVPWALVAAARRSPTLVALSLAACYLAAEPTVAIAAGGLALLLYPSRRAAAGAALAVGLVAVQALPFAAWVRAGERQAEGGELMAVGALLPAELPSLAFPGAPLPPRADRFLPALAFPLWALALGVVALGSRRREVRVLAAVGWLCAAAALLPALPGGDRLWGAVTFGMVRYPSRLLFLTALTLLPAAAAAYGERPLPRRTAAVLAVALTAAALTALAPSPRALLVAALAQVALACAALLARGGGLLWASALLVLAALFPTLELRRDAPWRYAIDCLAAQTGRVYAIEYSASLRDWMKGATQRGADMGFAYTPLLDGRRTVRSWAPLRSRALLAHVAEADRGPAGRWWLDALAARRIASHHPIPGFPTLCVENGFHVLENPSAWPESSIVARLPRPGERPVGRGRLRLVEGRDDLLRWRGEVDRDGGVLMRLAAPDGGWRYSVDGRPRDVERGPGIVHGIALPEGGHDIEARYRPPGLLAGLAVSLVAAALAAASARLHDPAVTAGRGGGRSGP